MAKIEQGIGKLISIDTEKKTLRFQEIPQTPQTSRSGQPPPKPVEWEHPYALEWEDQRFHNLVGKRTEYVLSDGSIVSLKSY